MLEEYCLYYKDQNINIINNYRYMIQLTIFILSFWIQFTTFIQFLI